MRDETVYRVTYLGSDGERRAWGQRGRTQATFTWREAAQVIAGHLVSVGREGVRVERAGWEAIA